MTPLMLEGNVDRRDELIANLQRQLEDLEDQLRASRAATQQERGKSASAFAALAALRDYLNPFKRAISAIYGELDLITDNVLPVTSTPQSNAKWDLWKKRFPGRGAELIDILLIHEQMNTKQLSTALKCDPRTLAQLIFKLNQAGLINKNGRDYSLKTL